MVVAALDTVALAQGSAVTLAVARTVWTQRSGGAGMG
jgi:hypothetical protein